MSANADRPTATPIARRPWYLAAALFALVWATIGTIDLFQLSRFGYGVDGDGTVRIVAPNSPAEASGLRVDDVLVRLGDTDPTDAIAFGNRPRDPIGARVSAVVERDGTKLDLVMVAAPLSPATRITGAVQAVIGLAFLALGWVVGARSGAAAWTLAALGLVCGFIFPHPYRFDDLVPRQAVGWILTVLTFAAVALFLRFALSFPRPHPLGLRRGTTIALFSTTVLAAVVGLASLIIDGGSFLRTPTGTVLLWQQRIFLVLALIALLRSFRIADRRQRRERGLTVLLWGTVVAIVPFLALSALTPTLGLPPGVPSLFLLALPISLGWAVARDATHRSVG